MILFYFLFVILIFTIIVYAFHLSFEGFEDNTHSHYGKITESLDNNDLLELIKKHNPDLRRNTTSNGKYNIKINQEDSLDYQEEEYTEEKEDTQLPFSKLDEDETKWNQNISHSQIPSSLNNSIHLNQDNTILSNIKRKRKKVKKSKNIKCKFFPSYTQGYTCSSQYPSHLGATFSAKANSGLLCNGKKIKTDPAKAYAIVKHGSIREIKLIHRGSGYVNHPKISIKGDGKYGKLKCKVSKDGSIKSIEIINGGKNYTDTPKIIIEKPNGYVYCHLCCQLDR